MNEITRARLNLLLVLLVAVLFVAGVYGIAIRPLLSSGASSAASAPVKSAAAELPPLPEPELLPLRPLKYSGRSFDWSGTVYNNIPGLNCNAVRTGILVDLDSRRVLWAKRANESVPVASMTKMMTLLLAFEKMTENPEITLDTPVKVSPGAAKIREGVIYLDPRETFPLRELLMAMTIKSANDAAYQVGDFLSNGDLPAFVAEMNTRAFELGMPGTHFINPHGLPDRQGNNSRSSAVGMVLLGEALLQYPQVMEWASTRQTFIRNGKTELTNTNNLFRRMHCPGVDGLKTGYTRAAGFCLTFTCLRNGRRLIGVVTGAARARERDDFAFALLNWGYGR